MRHVLKPQFHHHISVQLWSSYIIPLKCICLIYRQSYLPWRVVLRTRNCTGKGPSVWHTAGAPELLFSGSGELDSQPSACVCVYQSL